MREGLTLCAVVASRSQATVAPDLLEALLREVAGVQLADHHRQLVDAEALSQLRVLARLPATAHCAQGRLPETRLKAACNTKPSSLSSASVSFVSESLLYT